MRSERPWSMSTDRVLSHLQTDHKSGLSSQEAYRRLRRFGKNRLETDESFSFWQLWLRQFQDFMVLILLAATAVSYSLGEITDASVILTIVVMNAVLGFVQELRAERSLDALRQLAEPEATVRRGGQWTQIATEELVSGDIVQLEAGTRVPADGRMIESQQLQVDEASLTGESEPVAKHVEPVEAELPLAERRNMAYKSTLVTRGRGQMVVTSTGMDTEMGQIAHMLRSSKESMTPLQERLDDLGKVLVYACLIISAGVAVLGVIQGESMFNMFMAGVSLAVAAIPEGLPAVVTIALALGVQRLINSHVIIRHLPAVEALGSATLICTDKTGTITENRMAVQALVPAGGHVSYSPGEAEEGSGGSRMVRASGDLWQTSAGSAYTDAEKDPQLHRLCLIASLCNNAELSDGGQAWGDPTETALQRMTRSCGLAVESLSQRNRRTGENPFESSRRMMSVAVELSSTDRVAFQNLDGSGQDASSLVLVKGAPGTVLRRSSRYETQHGSLKRFDPAARSRIRRLNETMAGRGWRVLALAYRFLQRNEENMPGEWEQHLIFAGLVGMQDPPRQGVERALERCRQAGIRPVMVTGDQTETALAIARQIGLTDQKTQVISGSELEALSSQQLNEALDRANVFARVQPKDKLKIVQTFQSRGEVVAMTGDGINDAPAVKEADIGIAMGQKGTDVTREAASVILTDDHFASIIKAVEQGRGIYDNVRKFIRYMLACNIGEILVMFLTMLSGLPIPLLPIQILFINLVTDGLPAVALGMDPPSDQVMQRSPRPRNESIFARGLSTKIVRRGLTIGLVSAGLFALAYESRGDIAFARTVALSTLVISQLFHAVECRQEEGWGGFRLKGNPFILWADLSSFLMLISIVHGPFLGSIFHTVPLAMEDWLIVAAASVVGSVVDWIFESPQDTKPAFHRLNGSV